jgi:hypothetical protein
MRQHLSYCGRRRCLKPSARLRLPASRFEAHPQCRAKLPDNIFPGRNLPARPPLQVTYQPLKRLAPAIQRPTMPARPQLLTIVNHWLIGNAVFQHAPAQGGHCLSVRGMEIHLRRAAAFIRAVLRSLILLDPFKKLADLKHCVRQSAEFIAVYTCLRDLREQVELVFQRVFNMTSHYFHPFRLCHTSAACTRCVPWRILSGGFP